MKTKKTILTLTLFSLAVLGMGFYLAPSLRKANFMPGESKSDLELSDGSGSALKNRADADDNSFLSGDGRSEAVPSVRKNRGARSENTATVASSGEEKSKKAGNIKEVFGTKRKPRIVSERKEREGDNDGDGGSKGTDDEENTHRSFLAIGGAQNHFQREEGKISETSPRGGLKPEGEKTLTKLEKWRIERRKELAKLPPRLKKYYMEADAAFDKVMRDKWWAERRSFKNIFTKEWNREYRIIMNEFYEKYDSILDRYIEVYRNNHEARKSSELKEEERNELRALSRNYLEKLKSRTDWEEYQRYVKIRNNFLRETNEERKKHDLRWYLFF